MNVSAVSTACFALLDDCTASNETPRSRLYTGHVRTLAVDASDLPALWPQLQQALAEGLHAVGVFTYELGAAMQGIAPRAKSGESGKEPLPAAQILLFSEFAHLSFDAVGQWLAAQERDLHGPSGVADLRASVDEAQFEEAIARIQAYIAAGDTYQVNYTYRLRFSAFGNVFGLYRKLRQRQPVPYGALIALPDDHVVLSLSPELFVRHAGGMLHAQPMKGTMAATGDAQQDAERAAMLAADPKNRAENLMIVDLLRNDLGRVARAGSVTVPHLFAVDRFSSVLQMTSTVHAHLRRDVTLGDVFAAIYPCGSITGAPKRRTMQIIDEIEPDRRGIYTGAIGWFDAPRDDQPIGNFCLSVPIRTLVLAPPDAGGLRKGEMGVGAGIVHDSVAAEEYAECALKATFLTGVPKDFELFETMHATSAGCRHLALHLQRLQQSARYFGFAYSGDDIMRTIREACAALDDGEYRLRLALRNDGTHAITTAPIVPLQAPATLLLATEPIDATDLFLRHKTTVRERYDSAWRAAEAQGAFDMLFVNRDGELAEGARSNVFVRLDGRWYTPPLAAGLLPGVMRSVLLADPSWQATERRLTIADLRHAESIVVCNALRGALPATLQHQVG